MTKTRIAPWLVFACIGTLASCTSGEGGTAGNTELNVVVPVGGGSSAPAGIDIQVVEYTIDCDATPPTAGDFPGIDSIEPTFDPDVTINGVLEVLDSASSGVTDQDFGPDLGEVYVWQGFMDIPLKALCTVQLRARDDDGEVICTATEPFDTDSVAVGGTIKVNVLMYCGISFQAPVAMLDLDGDFSFNIANFCPDLFILNCIDTDIDVRSIPGIGETAATACQVRARDGDGQCGNACDPQVCTPGTQGLTCTPGPDPGVITTTVTCIPPGFACAAPGPTFGDACNPADADGGNGTCGLPPANTCAPGSPNAGDPCDPEAGDAGNADCGLPPPNPPTIPAACVPPVCVPGAVQDCTGTNTPAANCVFTGDVLGGIGDPPPGPLAPGPGGFFVACVTADDDGDPATPDVPVTPGATVTCQAVTTDGDTDCDKTKIVQVTCPGLTPCQAFGGDTACNDSADPDYQGQCQVGTCVDSGCDGTLLGCCSFVDAADGDFCDEAAPPSECLGGTCISLDCNQQPDPDASCDDGNECTIDSCDAPPATTCTNDAVAANGNPCNSNAGTCAGGTCVDNCTGTVCDSPPAGTEPECMAPSCDPTGQGGAPCDDNGACCSYAFDDTRSCTTCTIPSGGCLCDATAQDCINGCNIPDPVDAAGIPMACRNSFNQVVSTFPIDLLDVTPDECILNGLGVDFAIAPTIALDTAFLQAAADTLCDLGTALSAADISVAQVSIDGVQGATCTPQESALPGVGASCTEDADCQALSTSPDIFCGDQLPLGEPDGVPDTCLQTVSLDTTVIGTCGAGGGVIINSGVELPLPAVTLPCTVTGSSSDNVSICSTGEVPLSIDLSAAPADTFVGVSVGGGAIQVVFQCNTSSTTEPPPGTANEIPCIGDFPSTPNNTTCAAEIGSGDTGAEPFPTSLCLTDEPPSRVCVSGTNQGEPCKEVTVLADCPGATGPVCVGGNEDFQSCTDDSDCTGDITPGVPAICSVCAIPRCDIGGGNLQKCSGTCATVPVAVPPEDVCANFVVP